MKLNKTKTALTWNIYLGLYFPSKPSFGPVFLKCSQRCRARTMSDGAQKSIPLIQNLILLS